MSTDVAGDRAQFYCILSCLTLRDSAFVQLRDFMTDSNHEPAARQLPVGVRPMKVGKWVLGAVAAGLWLGAAQAGPLPVVKAPGMSGIAPVQFFFDDDD